MILADLIEGLDILYTRGNVNIEINGIAYDSRKVRKGYVFVCIDGMMTDGHGFAQQALGYGAEAFITQKPLAFDTDVPIIAVKDSRSALAYISDKYYGHISSKFNLIGITGTKG